MASNERNNLRDLSIKQKDGKELFTPVVFSLARQEKQKMRMATINEHSSGLCSRIPKFHLSALPSVLATVNMMLSKKKNR